MAVVRHFAGNICSKFSAPFDVNLDSLFKEKNMRNRLRLALLTLGTLAFAAAAAQASGQGWPIRPVTVVVPFAAGSSTDTAARILAVGMSEALGQQLVIENIGGASRQKADVEADIDLRRFVPEPAVSKCNNTLRVTRSPRRRGRAR
jgi:hypothetical protein